MRAKAIGAALFYGILPSRLYERNRHYAGSYLAHLWLNLQIAGRWATWGERHSDVRFHLEVNA
jgi:hypothetical protein